MTNPARPSPERTPHETDPHRRPAYAHTPLVIGIVFETFATYARSAADPEDAHVEYEPETTVELLEAAIASLGHTPRRLGSPIDVLALVGAGRSLGIDVAMNIAEGFGSRNREAWAPVLLEMAGVPTLGSDALTLSTSLDKAWTHRAVASLGVPVPAHLVLRCADEAARVDLSAAGLEFPLFVKPRWEGSAKGIRESSKVADRDELVREVRRVVDTYAQPALVEEFLPGAEYTVAVVGNEPPRALPVMQRALDRATGIGLHAVDRVGLVNPTEESAKFAAAEADAWLPGSLTPELERELQRHALTAFRALDCVDFARLDFRLDRLDAAGRPRFLEINPLPTFAVDGTFAILAELEGRPPEVFLGEVLEAGLTRLGLPGRARASAGASAGASAREQS